jgi:hypothetical protein
MSWYVCLDYNWTCWGEIRPYLSAKEIERWAERVGEVGNILILKPLSGLSKDIES